MRFAPFWPFCLALLCGHPTFAATATDAPPSATAEIRVAVVGGLARCGVWPELARRAETATGLRVTTIAVAPKGDILPRFNSGEADLLLIHGGDETFALLAQGMAAPLRAWAQNEHVIAGPPDDPAGVRAARDGAEALRRIAAVDAPLMGFRDPGSFGIVQRLWRASGVSPGSRQQLPDDSAPPQRILETAARQHAYVVVGHIPLVFGRMPNPAGYQVLLSGDPAMRRVYVAVEPGPRHPADPARRAVARTLADYLLSPAGQTDLAAANRAIATEQRPGPWILPLSPPATPNPASG
ncbi:substrate-binding domain-containing protein [Thiocystis violacea]|uniref:substrate-binding domain-containing protein n=1 Tax=Thiocystis violacea TaxID=13725 RepID=UPI0019054851|nr:substrate-binding domain-containing protein [Thiocystis violacea]